MRIKAAINSLFYTSLTALLLVGFSTPDSHAVPLNQLPDLLDKPTRFEFESEILTTSEAQLQSALAKLNAGDAAASIAICRDYLKKHPDSAPAHELLGAGLAIIGEIDQALSELQKAIEINPKQSSAHTKIGDIYLAQERYDEARKEYDQAKKVNPYDRLNYQRLGYLDERQGDIKSAIANYQSGLKGTPKGYVGLNLRLASLYNRVGAFPKAIELLLPLVPIDSNDADAHIVLGTSYLGLDQFSDAVTRYQRARELKSKETRISLALGIAYRAQANYEASLKEINQLIKSTPNWSTGYFQRGETANAMGQHEQALEAYRQAAKLNPNSLLTRKRIADTLLVMGRYDEAIKDLSALLDDTKAKNANYLTLLDTLANAYRSQEDQKQAESVYLRMIEEFPKSGFGYNRLGALYGYLRRYEDATKAFRQGLDVVPNDTVLLRNLSMAYNRNGDHDKAIATADQLVKLQPDSANSLVLLGSLQDEAGKSSEAAASYQAALKIDPANVQALNNLAMIRSSQGDQKAALQLISRAKKLIPDNGLILDTYGWVLYQNGKTSEALSALKQASGQIPGNPSIHYHLGVVHQHLKDNRSAQDAFRKALSISDSFPEAADARTRLTQLSR